MIWTCDVKKREEGYVGEKVLKMNLPGKRPRGRPKRRFMAAITKDMSKLEIHMSGKPCDFMK